jgi:hypothetical protein
MSDLFGGLQTQGTSQRRIWRNSKGSDKIEARLKTVERWKGQLK